MPERGLFALVRLYQQTAPPATAAREAKRATQLIIEVLPSVGN